MAENQAVPAQNQPTAEWLEQHARYLASAAWEERRSAVLQRDKYQCQARLERCTQKATQVHHLSYRHWRNEPLFDLASVCWVCHEEITRMDRGKLVEIVTKRDLEHEQFLHFWEAGLHREKPSEPEQSG